MALKPPETRYARSGDVYVAYQVVGDGPIDLVHTPGFTSRLEAARELPSAVRYATGTRTEETPSRPSAEQHDAYEERLGREWGRAGFIEARMKGLAPSRLGDDAFRRRLANEWRILAART